MSRRQFVILSRNSSSDGSLPPIGERRDIVAGLEHCNTAPETADGDILYGPGIEIELPPGQDPVSQMLLSISDEDIAWVVVIRLAREFGWKILDPNTGRELNP
ncbi:MAG: hypothetical protein KF724_04605 [Phycisphaeraceae bacterium]|nr:hypothetical protein [Phycisphaeraceae bacterium]